MREMLKAWRIMLILAGLNLILLGAYAGYGWFVLNARGLPAAGLMVIFLGAIGIFIVALVFAYLLRAGRAKNGVSVVLILLGGLALLQDPVRPELTASGVVGTSFVVVVTVTGIVGLYEENVK